MTVTAAGVQNAADIERAIGAFAQEPDGGVIVIPHAPRSDARGLGGTFDVIVECPQVAELIDLGHLVRSRVYAPVDPDLRGVGIRQGDFVEGELADRMDRPRRSPRICCCEGSPTGRSFSTDPRPVFGPPGAQCKSNCTIGRNVSGNRLFKLEAAFLFWPGSLIVRTERARWSETAMQQLKEFIRTDEGQIIWAVVNDAWLQFAIGSLVAMYVIGDLLAQA
jgi:hypothetical protein